MHKALQDSLSSDVAALKSISPIRAYRLSSPSVLERTNKHTREDKDRSPVAVFQSLRPVMMIITDSELHLFSSFSN